MVRKRHQHAGSGQVLGPSVTFHFALPDREP
jgi:hypothetical protein